MEPHDIALLQLKSQASGVTPVALYEGSDEVGQVVTFVGRGDIGTGLTGSKPTDGKKRGATNTITSVDDDWIFFNFDRGDDATDLEGVSGPGDSGGPALVTRDGKTYTLGVSVFSNGTPGHYGVQEIYTRVSTHRDGIESVISGKNTDGEIAITMGGGPVELPETPVGAMVGEYLQAYNSNDDAAMSAFVTNGFGKSYRSSRSDQEHLGFYRHLYDDRFGEITLRHVLEQDAAGLTALFQSARGPMAEFRFETDPQARIAGIRVMEVKLDHGP